MDHVSMTSIIQCFLLRHYSEVHTSLNSSLCSQLQMINSAHGSCEYSFQSGEMRTLWRLRRGLSSRCWGADKVRILASGTLIAADVTAAVSFAQVM